MKTIQTLFILLLLPACFAATAQAQVAGPPAWIAGGDLRGNLPMGDFSDVASFGVGGTVYAGYMFSPMFALTFRTGYIFTGGKEIQGTLGGVSGTLKTNYGVAPLLGGAKVLFGEGDMRGYIGAEAGMYILNASYEVKNALGGAVTSGSDSDTKFGYSPAIGAQFRAGRTMMVDAHVEYTAIPTDDTDLTWVGFGIGLEWTLE